jgi:hypothetical protein
MAVKSEYNAWGKYNAWENFVIWLRSIIYSPATIEKIEEEISVKLEALNKLLKHHNASYEEFLELNAKYNRYGYMFDWWGNECHVL